MSGSALILTYHSVSAGPAPLCIAPRLFEEHLDVLMDAGASTLSIAELASALRSDVLPERPVAITFDDGYADVAAAAGMLADRGMTATVFCVAGYLGAVSDWPTLPDRARRLPLAGPEQIAELAAAGFEIGSHGVEHAPLRSASGPTLRRELVDSRAMLEDAAAATVTSFAFPYGAQAPPSARDLLSREYEAACIGGLARVGPGVDPLALPRVDAHYLRRPSLLRRTVEGSAGPYLALRRAGARLKRLAISDDAR